MGCGGFAAFMAQLKLLAANGFDLRLVLASHSWTAYRDAGEAFNADTLSSALFRATKFAAAIRGNEMILPLFIRWPVKHLDEE